MSMLTRSDTGGLKPPEHQHSARGSLRRGSYWLGGFIALAVLVTLLAIWAYSASLKDDKWDAVATLLLYAAASIAVGAFFGFLFGIPRTRTFEVKGGESPSGEQGTRTTVKETSDAPNLTPIMANTNLEQVSDWLTKIIVGVTLVSLGSIPSNAVKLFEAMALPLPGGAQEATFVGALVVYSAAAGFMIGWLVTRVWIALLIMDGSRAVEDAAHQLTTGGSGQPAR